MLVAVEADVLEAVLGKEEAEAVQVSAFVSLISCFCVLCFVCCVVRCVCERVGVCFSSALGLSPHMRVDV